MNVNLDGIEKAVERKDKAGWSRSNLQTVETIWGSPVGSRPSTMKRNQLSKYILSRNKTL